MYHDTEQCVETNRRAFLRQDWCGRWIRRLVDFLLRRVVIKQCWIPLRLKGRYVTVTEYKYTDSDYGVTHKTVIEIGPLYYQEGFGSHAAIVHAAVDTAIKEEMWAEEYNYERLREEGKSAGEVGEAQLARLRKDHPYSLKTINKFRVFLQEQGHHEDAKWLLSNPTLKEYRELIRVDPQCVDAYINLSGAYEGIGCDREAIDVLKEASTAITDKDDLSWIYFNLGLAYGAHNQWREQVESLKQCTCIDSDMSRDTAVTTNYFLGIAYGQLGLWQEAAEVLQKVIKAKPDDYHALYGLAEAYGHLGRTDEEMAICRQSIQDNSQNYWAYMGLGRAYGRHGDLHREIEAYKEAIRLSADFTPAHLALGQCHMKTRHYQEAIDAFKQCIRINPGLSDAHLNLIIAYNAMGNEKSALQQLQEFRCLGC